MNTQLLCSQHILIWFLVSAAVNNLCSVNTAMEETRIPGSDYGTVDGQRPSCKNKKSPAADVINLSVEFNMDHKNEKPNGTAESQPHIKLEDKIMNNFILENWSIPAEIIKNKTTTSLFTGQGDVETLMLQPTSNRMWYAPRLGRRDKRSRVNDEQVKQESARGGMWFGPRLGRRDKKSSINDEQVKQEFAYGGMWFGPRLGRRDKKSNVNDEQVKQEVAYGGMWFGPRLGRRDKKSNVHDEQVKQEVAHGGMWFGPRLGRREKKSYENEWPKKPRPFWMFLETTNKPREYDFLPQFDQDTVSEIYATAVNNITSELENYSSQLSDDIGIMKYSPSSRVRFSSQLGHKQKKATNVIAYVPQEVQMWTSEDKNNKPPEYDFTPRLGRELYEKGLTLASKSLRLPQIGHNTGIKYVYFQQD
ncbi:uncharacterized protein LOC110827992 [Zootermopsis nevadensis]|uniref:uncharacterized protein LOC110827992 n=1 Tax=Zootermopsis nevadensis TaxID=136037 RepID=UPI000B8E2110|nr:uncharacterized protein LOC110827992 [Zootermopsis nevadensis]